VQVAKLLGAGRVVASGRRDDALAQVAALGADAVINTEAVDDELAERYRAASGGGYDVVLDFLWGRPTQVLLASLVPERIGFGRSTRVVQVGEAAGDRISVTADSIRTSGVELVGAAKGMDAETVADDYQQIVEWVRAGRLEFGVEVIALSEIEDAWIRPTSDGRRLVVAFP
jgi:NADPH2:quinone reductase